MCYVVVAGRQASSYSVLYTVIRQVAIQCMLNVNKPQTRKEMLYAIATQIFTLLYRVVPKNNNHK